MSAEEMRALVDETQLAMHLATRATAESLAKRSLRFTTSLTADVTLTATGTGAVPWWAPCIWLAVVTVFALATIRGDERQISRQGFDIPARNWYPRSRARFPALTWAASLALGLFAVGVATGWWWSGLVLFVPLAAMARAFRNHLRAAYERPGPWPKANGARPSRVLSDPVVLRLTSALAEVRAARVDTIEQILDLEPGSLEVAVPELRRYGYIKIWLRDDVGPQLELTKHGRQSFREHLTTLGPDS